METRNDRVVRIVSALAAVAADAGVSDFSINVSGEKSTIESECGDVIARRAAIKSISLYINFDDCEDGE